MLPVTRANLDHICCICLLDIRPSMYTQKVYDVKEEKNLSRVLKLTAHITVLKNPINQKYINDYCRKVCETCFLKTQYSFVFREKIVASSAALKEVLESNELDDVDIERLRVFCRVCLNRQSPPNTGKNLNMELLQWLKDCSGIRFTSLIDREKFRIKEGTNINELAVINDSHFPQQLCRNCLKKLQNVEEFRKSATQSFEYMISVMGDATELTENILLKTVTQRSSTPVIETSMKQDCELVQMKDIKGEVEEFKCVPGFSHDISNTTDPIVNKSDYKSTHKLEDNAFEYVMDLMDEIPHYSDEEWDNVDGDVHFTSNLSNDELSSEEFNDSIKTTSTRTTRSKTSKQSNKITLTTEDEENTTRENSTKPCKRKKRNKSKNNNLSTEGIDEIKIEKDKNSTKAGKIKKERKNQKTLGPVTCETCSRIFPSMYSFKRHQKNVHILDPNKIMYTCSICSKEFKRKSHLDDHIKSVHEKLRAFKCSHCEKSFASNSSKRVHELTHTGDFPFACEWCGKRFRQSFRLKVHIEIHTTTPELLCPICKRCQKTKQDLEDHLKSHEDKRMQCPSCGKLFNRSSHLKDHYNAVHLKLRPFKCEFCEMAFGDRKTRRVHEKSHTEERPVTCTVCKRGFKDSKALCKHAKQSGHSTEQTKAKENKSKKKTAQLQSLHYAENFNSIFELGTQYLGNTL